MNILKFRKPKTNAAPVSSRRSFIWKMGAGVSAASVPGLATAATADSSSAQLAMLKEENNIRNLHHDYESLMNQGRYSDIPAMFSDGAQVVFNGGVFNNKEQGVSRLYTQHFTAGMTGKSMQPAPGFELDAEQKHNVVHVAPNLLSATAMFTYSIQVGMPMNTDSQLVQMARLQGEGIQKWWEGGVYEVSYVKDVEAGNWKIQTLEYKTLSRANYRPGRTYAEPIVIPQFSTLYPNEASGPDKLA